MKFLFLFIIIITYSNLIAQNIHWDKVDIGLNANYIITESDFNMYWGNSFLIGGVGKYQIGNNIFVQGEMNFSLILPKDENIYPSIYYLGLPLGFKYNFMRSGIVDINVWSGIQSSTFFFSGEMVEERFKDNTNESEFGYFISLGFSFFNYKDLELTAKYQSLFSTPEQLKIYLIGLKIFLL